MNNDGYGRPVKGFGPQKIHQNGRILTLVCVSKLPDGGVVIRKDAYEYIRKFSDRFDCRFALKNLETGWAREAPLDQLPVKPAVEFSTGAQGWIVDACDFDDSGPDDSVLEDAPF
jgi:hypothetical protein